MRIGFDGWKNELLYFLYSLYVYVCDNELLFLSLFFLFNFKMSHLILFNRCNLFLTPPPSLLKKLIQNVIVFYFFYFNCVVTH